MPGAKEVLIEYLKSLAYEIGYAEGVGEDKYIEMLAEEAQEDIYDYIDAEYNEDKKLIKAILEERIIPPILTNEIVESYSKGYEEGQKEQYYEQSRPSFGILRRFIRRRRFIR